MPDRRHRPARLAARRPCRAAAAAVVLWACSAAPAAVGRQAALEVPYGPRVPTVATRPSRVRATLLADVKAIRPGKVFTLGVLLNIAPGWHVYWVNPGDAGLATSVTFRLPKGFRAGPLQWPLPASFRQPGDIIGYGYSKSVLLSARITPPKKLPAAAPLAFDAEVSWLACRERCVRGDASLRLALPVGEPVQGASAAVFDRWRKRLPVPANAPGAGATAAVAGRIAPGAKSGRFTVVLTWKRPPARVEWYPAAGPTLAVGDVSIGTTGRRTRVTFTVTSLAGGKDAAGTLQTVAAGIDAKGRRLGVAVPVRLRKTQSVASSPAAKRPPEASPTSNAAERSGS